jgi:YidC/Oxa1 family membrane protein insertase
VLQKRNFWPLSKQQIFIPEASTINPIELNPTINTIVNESVSLGTQANLIDTSLIDSTPVLEAITEVGNLKLLGLASSYTPVGWIQSMLEINHVLFDHPWWITIASTTLLVRFLVLPLAIKSQRGMGKMAALRPELEPIQEEMMKCKKLNDAAGVTRQSQKLQELFQKSGINPISSALLGFAQAPIFLSFFLAVRKMGDLPVPGLENGGIYWFTDLSLADPYFILPIVSSLTMLLGFEVLKILNRLMRICQRISRQWSRMLSGECRFWLFH